MTRRGIRWLQPHRSLIRNQRRSLILSLHLNPRRRQSPRQPAGLRLRQPPHRHLLRNQHQCQRQPLHLCRRRPLHLCRRQPPHLCRHRLLHQCQRPLQHRLLHRHQRPHQRLLLRRHRAGIRILSGRRTWSDRYQRARVLILAIDARAVLCIGKTYSAGRILF